ncbi:MAG TPA: diguanylate cyclase, partial [Candidatus Polarisedimenticolia bacterium]|nr:diguanylate cyclase [Candidatus Polarisedimenticolia bacterium]
PPAFRVLREQALARGADPAKVDSMLKSVQGRETLRTYVRATPTRTPILPDGERALPAFEGKLFDETRPNPPRPELEAQQAEALAAAPEAASPFVEAALAAQEHGAERTARQEAYAARKAAAREASRAEAERVMAETGQLMPAAPGATEAPPVHKFSSTQVDLPPETANRVLAEAAKIPDSILAEDGRETRPHITVKYGLETDDVAPVQSILAGEAPIKVKLGKVSIFPAKEGAPYDVVKADVDSPDLHRLNAKIADALPTTDTHPEYKPHVTLAYVKPGEGKRFVGDAALAGHEITLDKVTFTSRDGKEHSIPLGGQGGVPMARGGERRLEQQPVAEDRRIAQRRAEVAQETGLPEDHPAVEKVLQTERERDTDLITGIGNLRTWEALKKSVDKDKDHVLYMDLQKFKTTNDTYGHAAGDDVLRATANVLKKHLGDDAARIHGDEFGGIFRGLSEDQAWAKAEAIRDDLRQTTVRVRNPKTGETVDIAGIEAHIGLGRDEGSADTSANAVAEASRKGGRGAVPAPETEGRTEPAAPGSPGAGLGDRPEGLASPAPAEAPTTAEPTVPRRGRLREPPKDEMGNPILPGQESWSPDRRAAVRAAARDYAQEAFDVAKGEPPRPGFFRMQPATESVANVAGVEPGHYQRAVQSGLHGTPLEGVASPKQILDALDRDKGNALEMRVLEAVDQDRRALEYEEGIRADREPSDAIPPEGEADTSFDPTKFATAPRETDKLGFFSALGRAVDDTKQGAANGSAWLSYLKDPKRAVKADELKWTGLDDYLRERSDRRVTKQEVQEFLKANDVQVEEVTLADSYRGKTKTPDEWTADADRLEQLGRQRQRNGFPAQAETAFRLAAEARQHAEGVNPETGSVSGTPKFAQYTLPGGENYREVLLTLPSQFGLAESDRAILRKARAGVKDLSMDEFRRFNELTGANGPGVFKGGHFDEPNVLAHIRLNDRTDAQGKRVLFVEEIQSDWAQKGRREGFAASGPAPEIPEGWTITPPPSGRGDWALKNAAGERIAAGPEDAVRQSAREISASLRRQGPPAAPFVTSTEGWTNLALKRVLRMAAEEGYDRVAWTTGEQQSARYDLSKHVDSVTVWADPKGGYHFEAKKNGIELASEPRGKQITAKDLADHIGKDLADRAVADIAEGKPAKYSGLDLKVGGEGMAGFYDKILPAAMGKLGKKWGAKVGETEIPAPRKATRTSDTEGVIHEGGNFKAHSIDITPEMRRSVGTEGFARFRAGERQAPKPLSLEKVKAGIPGLDFQPAEGGFVAKLRDGGELRVNAVGEIEVRDPAALEASRNAPGGGGEPVGSYQRIGRDSIINIAKTAPEGTVDHEGFHFVFERALSDKERAAVLKKYGDEEAAAYAYAKWKPESQTNSWFSRMMAYARRLYRSFRPTWESVFEETRSGRAGQRVGVGSGEGERFATSPKTETPAFKRWFGESKVVDAEGKPLTVYHGTNREFTAFDPAQSSSKTGNPNAELGHFFTDDPAEASRYAKAWGEKGGNVVPAHLSIKNPYEMPYKEFDALAMVEYRGLPDTTLDSSGRPDAASRERLAANRKSALEAARARRAELIAAGYDGIHVKASGKGRAAEWIAFDPTQIKSSIGNRGTFDPTNPDIRYATARPGQRGLEGIAEDVPT